MVLRRQGAVTSETPQVHPRSENPENRLLQKTKLIKDSPVANKGGVANRNHRQSQAQAEPDFKHEIEIQSRDVGNDMVSEAAAFANRTKNYLTGRPEVLPGKPTFTRVAGLEFLSRGLYRFGDLSGLGGVKKNTGLTILFGE